MKITERHCAYVGVFFTFLSLLLVAIGSGLQHFVDVYMINDASKDPTEGDLMATVGVFQATYDARDVSEEALLASSVPQITFETSTENFPLLFPAQQNFAAVVLPLTPETIEELDADAAEGEDLLGPAVTPNLIAIQNLGFESCSSYMAEAEPLITEVFDQFQNLVLPTIVSRAIVEAVDGFNEAIPFVNVVTGSNPSANVMFLMTSFLVLQASNIPDGCAFSDESKVDANFLSCLNAGAEEMGPSEVIKTSISALAESISTECDDETEEISRCLLRFDYSLVDTSLISRATFEDTSKTNIAKAIGFGSGLGYVKATYLQDVLALGDEFDIESLVEPLGVIGLYLASVSLGLIATTKKVSEAEIIVGFEESLPPVNFDDDYKPCLILQLVELATNTNYSSVPDFKTEDNVCPFKNHYQRLAEISLDQGSKEDAETMLSIQGLYDRCSESLPVSSCPKLFTAGLIDGTYDGEVGTENVEFVGVEPDLTKFFARAVEECEKDEEDHEKITRAQKILIAGDFFFAFTLAGVLFSLFSLHQSSERHQMFAKVGFSLAAASSILASVLTLGALLVVRSAPVYESVGGDPVQFSPYFIDGSVPPLAIVAFFLGLCSAGFYTGAVYKLSKAKDYEQGVADEKKSEKGEEKKEESKYKSMISNEEENKALNHYEV